MIVIVICIALVTAVCVSVMMPSWCSFMTCHYAYMMAIAMIIAMIIATTAIAIIIAITIAALAIAIR